MIRIKTLRTLGMKTLGFDVTAHQDAQGKEHSYTITVSIGDKVHIVTIGRPPNGEK